MECKTAAVTTLRKITISLAANLPEAPPMIMKQAMRARCLASFRRRAAITRLDTWNGPPLAAVLRSVKTIGDPSSIDRRHAAYAISSR
jgi:hypothetical protein